MNFDVLLEELIVGLRLRVIINISEINFKLQIYYEMKCMIFLCISVTLCKITSECIKYYP